MSTCQLPAAFGSITNRPSMDSPSSSHLEHKPLRRTLAGIWGRIRTSTFWMVAIALLLRVGWIVVAHTYRFKSTDNNFGFGWEMGRIGASIATGHGFSNPFGPPTGPTAWEPPLYPFLIAGVFKLFGIYSKLSAVPVVGNQQHFLRAHVHSDFPDRAARFLRESRRRRRLDVGPLPLRDVWCTKWVWETSLSALLVAVVFWMALTLEDREGWLPWLEFGLLWGVAALSSTVLLSFLPASGLWAWYHRGKRHKPSIAGVALASVVFFACITPWVLRNERVFGRFIFIRDNFGAELRLGNGNGADGTWMEYLHPTQDVYAMRQYQSMGELAYIAMRQQQAFDYIQADYGRFAGLCVKRFVYYWAGAPRPSQDWRSMQIKNSLFLASSILMFWGLGRALRHRRPGAWLFFWLIVSYTAIYYVVFPHPMVPASN